VSVTRSRLTFEQFLAQCPDQRIVEWVGGEAVEHVPPVTRHQQVLGFLHSLLLAFAQWSGQGEVIVAPFLMRLSLEGPAREPDILFVARDSLARILPDRLEGPADLAVEIVSDDSVARDRAEKFYEYQEFGVREYWLIDPRPRRQRADFWVRNAAGIYTPAADDAAGVYRSTVLPGFWLRPTWLSAEPLPSSLAAFGEIAGLPPEVIRAISRRQP